MELRHWRTGGIVERHELLEHAVELLANFVVELAILVVATKVAPPEEAAWLGQIVLWKMVEGLESCQRLANYNFRNKQPITTTMFVCNAIVLLNMCKDYWIVVVL